MNDDLARGPAPLQSFAGSRSPAGRALAFVASALSLGGGAWIAFHHPLSPAIAAGAFLLWSAAAARWPLWWLAGLPAVLPIVDLAPWTGSIMVEEWDLLVLATAAGGYAALALTRAPRIAHAEVAMEEGAWSIPGTSRALVVAFGISTLVALVRGLQDAGFAFQGGRSGYYDALNSLRVLKGFAFACLLMPLFAIQARGAWPQAMRWLFLGLAAAAATAGLATVWERVAFPGLLDFTSDYRVTAQFWEMHVGGAALDGLLALTLPFVVAGLVASKHASTRIAATVLLTLAFYASLVTFSRGLYLALAVEAGLLAALFAWRAADPRRGAALLARTVVIAAAAGVLGWLVFRTGGYRALAAVFGVYGAAVLLPVRRPPLAAWVGGVLGGAVLGGLSILLALVLPRSIYTVYAVAFAACALVWARADRFGASLLPALATGALTWLAIAAAALAGFWGGEDAALDTLLALVACGVVATSTLRSGERAPDRTDATFLLVRLGVPAVVAALVAVFVGGGYMGTRVSTVGTDLEGRIEHWSSGVGMLRGAADWSIGKGLGRFPANYLFNVRDSVFPGSFRLDADAAGRRLTLFGPRYPTSFGDLFRISQRVTPRPGAYVARFDARAAEDVRVHVEICEKQLLYSGRCALATLRIAGKPGEWQHIVAPLDARALGTGSWFAPRLAFFSIAIETSARTVEIANMGLAGPDGAERLRNGDFADGMAHWFFTSDRYHLPWHIKSLPLNVLFEQGIVGLVVFALLVATALIRLVAGSSRREPQAPYLAAAIAGFLVVGAFDSLTDVPRLAFAFWLVLLVALSRRSVRLRRGNVSAS